MTIQATRLLRIELTVADLPRSEAFYVDALGFERLRPDQSDPSTAGLLGAGGVRQAALHRGGQTLVLQQFDQPGQPYPSDARACDQVFQHFALPVPDMAFAYGRLLPLLPAAISIGGPQHLPQRSGGATAFKFRDPDGHPLELIQFPDAHIGGIDHSAIAVMDVERSLTFYRDHLGLRMAARQTNSGVEQDRLDGLAGAVVDVVALEPAQATPHVELLGYRAPAGRPAGALRLNDMAATRLVLEVTGMPTEGDQTVLRHDPDGHALVLVGSNAPAGSRAIAFGR